MMHWEFNRLIVSDNQGKTCVIRKKLAFMANISCDSQKYCVIM